MLLDNLLKQSLSKYKIYRLRLVSLLEVNFKIEVVDDFSNNEGIFFFCVEISERELQNMFEVRDSILVEIGDSDFFFIELDIFRVGEGVCEDMQYFRFFYFYDYFYDIYQYIDYSFIEKFRNKEGVDQVEEFLRIQVKGYKVLLFLVFLYRGKSIEDLLRNKLLELYFFKEIENWQNMLFMVIENNVFFQNF